MLADDMVIEKIKGRPALEDVGKPGVRKIKEEVVGEAGGVVVRRTK